MGLQWRCYGPKHCQYYMFMFLISKIFNSPKKYELMKPQQLMQQIYLICSSQKYSKGKFFSYYFSLQKMINNDRHGDLFKKVYEELKFIKKSIQGNIYSETDKILEGIKSSIDCGLMEDLLKKWIDAFTDKVLIQSKVMCQYRKLSQYRSQRFKILQFLQREVHILATFFCEIGLKMYDFILLQHYEKKILSSSGKQLQDQAKNQKIREMEQILKRDLCKYVCHCILINKNFKSVYNNYLDFCKLRDKELMEKDADKLRLNKVRNLFQSLIKQKLKIGQSYPKVFFKTLNKMKYFIKTHDIDKKIQCLASLKENLEEDIRAEQVKIVGEPIKWTEEPINHQLFGFMIALEFPEFTHALQYMHYLTSPSEIQLSEEQREEQFFNYCILFLGKEPNFYQDELIIIKNSLEFKKKQLQ